MYIKNLAPVTLLNRNNINLKPRFLIEKSFRSLVADQGFEVFRPLLHIIPEKYIFFHQKKTWNHIIIRLIKITLPEKLYDMIDLKK